MDVRSRINLNLRILREQYNLDLRIERHSPGDGWTRYEVKHQNSGYRMANSMTANECNMFLNGIYEFHRLQNNLCIDAEHAAKVGA